MWVGGLANQNMEVLVGLETALKIQRYQLLPSTVIESVAGLFKDRGRDKL